MSSLKRQCNLQNRVTVAEFTCHSVRLAKLNIKHRLLALRTMKFSESICIAFTRLPFTQGHNLLSVPLGLRLMVSLQQDTKRMTDALKVPFICVKERKKTELHESIMQYSCMDVGWNACWCTAWPILCYKIDIEYFNRSRQSTSKPPVERD